MFSGIVEEKGRIKRMTNASGGYRLTVESHVASKGSRIGESISVNGTCLTIVEIRGKDMSFDVMEETLGKTNLSGISTGAEVNLERSIKAGERISGHYVTGHIDCIGKILTLKNHANDYAMDVKIPEDKTVYVAEKGSIAIDGISLTVANITGNCVRVYLIPMTLKATTLGSKKVNDPVNIEFDILGKYALKRTPLAKKEIDVNFLKEHGFA